MTTKNRKYARPSRKNNSSNESSDDTEFTLSTTAAIGILGGTFLVGVATGKLIDMFRK